MKRLTAALTIFAIHTGASASDCEIDAVNLENLCARNQTAIFEHFVVGESPFRSSEGDECKVFCIPTDGPLPKPRLQCMLDGHSLLCESLTRGPSLRYRWASTPQLAPAMREVSRHPYQSFDCGSHVGPVRISVRLLSEYSRSEPTAVDLSCEFDLFEAPLDPVMPPPVPDPIE